MASEVKLNGNELLEVDICDRGGVCSEDERGVFVSAASHLQGDFSGFQEWTSPAESEFQGDGTRAARSSIVDCLLVELYETCSGGSRRNVDSWDSSTEASGSDAFLGRSNSGSSFLQELQEKHTRRHQMNYLAQKGDKLSRCLPRCFF